MQSCASLRPRHLDILSIAGRGVLKPFSLRDDSRDGGRFGLLPSRGISPSLEGRGRTKSGTGVEKGGDGGKGVRHFHFDRGF